MAVAMFMRFTGISPREYDLVIASLELDASPAAGHIVHVVCETNDGLLACDVFQTRETAESFVTSALGPRLAALQPSAGVDWEILQLRNLYAPDVDTIERIGAVSLPAYAVGNALR